MQLAKLHRYIGATDMVAQILFCTSSANIFINPRSVCCDTEKGGKGARDTETTTREGVTRRVAWGDLHPQPAQVEGYLWETYPPPPHNPTFETAFQLPRYILRMASNLEVVSGTADIGQQQ